MKQIIVMLVLGLMLATTFSGCVGEEKTQTYAPPQEETQEQQQVENQTESNKTMGVIYHAEHSGELITLVDGTIDYPFPVNESAKKIVVILVASGVPGVIGGVWAWIQDPSGNDVVDGGSDQNEECKLEVKEKQIINGGYGDWNVHLVSQVADVQTTYTLKIDVYGLM